MGGSVEHEVCGELTPHAPHAPLAPHAPTSSGEGKRSTSKSKYQSDVLSSGDTFTITATAVGVIKYSCTVYTDMVGTITVVEKREKGEKEQPITPTEQSCAEVSDKQRVSQSTTKIAK